MSLKCEPTWKESGQRWERGISRHEGAFVPPPLRDRYATVRYITVRTHSLNQPRYSGCHGCWHAPGQQRRVYARWSSASCNTHPPHPPPPPSWRTRGPSWGHPMLVLGAILSFLEPFVRIFAKIDKISLKLTFEMPARRALRGSRGAPYFGAESVT